MAPDVVKCSALSNLLSHASHALYSLQHDGVVYLTCKLKGTDEACPAPRYRSCTAGFRTLVA
jgi:hypothetical protein